MNTTLKKTKPCTSAAAYQSRYCIWMWTFSLRPVYMAVIEL